MFFQRTCLRIHLRPIFGFLLALLLSFLTLLYGFNVANDNSNTDLTLMRLCIPKNFNLSSSSSSFHIAHKWSCRPRINNTIIFETGLETMSTSTNGYPGGKLADYLRIQKKAFLSDLKGGQANGWVLAMGNEAGGVYSSILRLRLCQQARLLYVSECLS